MTESSDASAHSVRPHVSSPNFSSPTELSFDFDEEESFLGGEEDVAPIGSRRSGEEASEDDENFQRRVAQELGQRPRYYEEEDWFDEADQEAFNSTHHPERDELDPIQDADDFDVVVENDLDEYEE